MEPRGQIESGETQYQDGACYTDEMEEILLGHRVQFNSI